MVDLRQDRPDGVRPPHMRGCSLDGIAVYDTRDVCPARAGVLR